MTGTSHHSCERCPNTTPIFFTCSLRDFQGTRPSIRAIPAVWREDPAHNLVGAAFPRAIGADVPDHFARADCKGNVVQGFYLRICTGKQGLYRVFHALAASRTRKVLQIWLSSITFFSSCIFTRKNTHTPQNAGGCAGPPFLMRQIFLSAAYACPFAAPGLYDALYHRQPPDARAGGVFSIPWPRGPWRSCSLWGYSAKSPHGLRLRSGSRRTHRAGAALPPGSVPATS